MRSFSGNIIDLWTVYETVDEYGRRGGIVGYFDTRSKADAAAVGKGFYGSNGLVVNGFGLRINDDGVLPLVLDHPVPLNIDALRHAEEIRESALAKLTPTERAALGIR